MNYKRVYRCTQCGKITTDNDRWYEVIFAWKQITKPCIRLEEAQKHYFCSKGCVQKAIKETLK